MNPKVTIAIPVYNSESYLRGCLDSVIQQTLNEIEIICINDGSTDSSPQILEEYKSVDERIVILNKENSGYGSAMNDALDIARGEYFGIVEPDDYIDRTMYADLYSLASSNQANVVKSAWFEENKSNTEKKNPYSKIPCNCLIHLDSYPQILQWHPSTPMGIYRLSFLKEKNIRYVEAPGAGWVDNTFFIQVMYHALEIVVTDNAYYHYRVGDFDHSSVIKDCSIPMSRIKDMLDFLDSVDDHSIFRRAVEKRAFVYLRRTLDSVYYPEQKETVRPLIQSVFERLNPCDLKSDYFTSNERKIHHLFSKKNDSEIAPADNPKVSIVVPIYNVANYLAQCLESISSQTLNEIEVICVDDGSTDFSRFIANCFADADPRIQLVCHKTNHGYGKGMNTGMDRARGEYVGIVEPDDFISCHMYELLYECAVENDLDICKADFFRFKTARNGDVSLSYNSISSHASDYGVIIDPIYDQRFYRFVMNTWPAIYRRSLIAENDIRHNETPGASFQDNGFFMQTSIFAHRVMLLKRPLYFNRRDNPNSSVASKSKVYCMDEEYAFIRRILETNSCWSQLKEVWSNLLFRNMMFTYSRIADQFKSEYIEHASKVFRSLRDQDDIKFTYFNDSEKRRLTLLLSDPQSFAEQNGSAEDIQQLKQQVRKFEESYSWKIGRAITSLPRAIKRSLKHPKK